MYITVVFALLSCEARKASDNYKLNNPKVEFDPATSRLLVGAPSYCDMDQTQWYAFWGKLYAHILQCIKKIK